MSVDGVYWVIIAFLGLRDLRKEGVGAIGHDLSFMSEVGSVIWSRSEGPRFWRIEVEKEWRGVEDCGRGGRFGDEEDEDEEEDEEEEEEEEEEESESPLLGKLSLTSSNFGGWSEAEDSW